jgi:hypothetical protein
MMGTRNDKLTSAMRHNTFDDHIPPISSSAVRANDVVTDRNAPQSK